MTNDELKRKIADVVLDEDELDHIIVLEGDEFADGAIGLTIDNNLVYSYEKLIDSLTEVYGSETDAIDWLEYNTIRSLSYMGSYGNEPIIIHEL